MLLSILDQSPISEGSTGADALRNTLDLARLGDELGYSRYWVAEHHGTPMLACASPEVMIASIGSITQRIRVGSGGVMLPHYSPLKVAETFSILSALFPGRVDLGIGRAPGTDHATAFALQRDRRRTRSRRFSAPAWRVAGYLENRLPAGILSRRCRRCPDVLTRRMSGCWVFSAERPVGRRYRACHMFSPISSIRKARRMRRFIGTGCVVETLAKPHTMVASWVICAETDEEAQRIASSARMTRALLNEGQLIPVPPIDKALRFLAERGPSPDTVARPRRAIIGSPAGVKKGIEDVAALYGADEVMIVSITYEHSARRRSYQLIAEAIAWIEPANSLAAGFAPAGRGLRT